MKRPKTCKETVTVSTRVKIEYEDRPGAREMMLRSLRENGPVNSWGCHVDYGCHSTQMHKRHTVQ